MRNFLPYLTFVHFVSLMHTVLHIYRKYQVFENIFQTAINGCLSTIILRTPQIFSRRTILNHFTQNKPIKSVRIYVKAERISEIQKKKTSLRRNNKIAEITKTEDKDWNSF